MTELVSSPTTCAGTRRDGQRCRSTVLGPDGFCVLHGASPRLDPAEIGRNGGKRSGEVRREAAKSVRDRLRERVEENVDRVWSAFEAGLDADDERVRVTAAQALLAEAYGRPPQAITGADGGPLAVRHELIREATERLTADLELDAPLALAPGDFEAAA